MVLSANAVARVPDAETLRAPFPADVEFVLSAMEAAPAPPVERRRFARFAYRVRAVLRLFSDEPSAELWELFTRQVSARSLDFVCRDRLPLSHGGWIALPSPDGSVLRAHCTILRCRPAGPGWFDGALYFNREQEVFLNAPPAV